MSVQLEWDAVKAEAKVETHGGAFDEALTVCADPSIEYARPA